MPFSQRSRWRVNAGLDDSIPLGLGWEEDGRSQLEAEAEAVQTYRRGEQGDGHSGGTCDRRRQIEITHFVIPFVGAQKRQEARQHFR